jgi:hypothetical protein
LRGMDELNYSCFTIAEEIYLSAILKN